MHKDVSSSSIKMFSLEFVERILELILLFLFREWRIDGIAIDWNLMN